MSEPKPFASLSSGLLARKGAARPAMRPQGFGQGGAALEDLGWNDMGFEAPKAAEAPRDGEHDAFGEEIVEHPRALHRSGLTPVESPVHGQQAEIADRFKGADDAGDADAETDFDEEYDDTAELYEPEAAEDVAAVPFKKTPVLFAQPEPALEGPALEEPVTEERVAEEPVAEEAVTEEAVAEKPVAEEPLVLVQPVVAAPVEASPRRATRQRSAPGPKAAFTLRLDQSRHLKLRLASAVNGRSAQMIVTEALDQMLAAMPELDAMAEKAKPKGT